MAARYSKRSVQQIHWTTVGYNSVLQGLSYEQVRTKDAQVNTWITHGRVKAQCKLDRQAKRPKTGVIPASQLDPANWTAKHNLKRKSKEQDEAALALATAEAVLAASPKGGGSWWEIEQVIERLQSMVKPCPCCGADAKLGTTDTMTYTIECQNRDCRLKIERGVVNERGPRQCMQLIISAWNQRQAAVDEVKFGQLMQAARRAADEMCRAATGTPAFKLGSKLDDIVDELTP